MKTIFLTNEILETVIQNGVEVEIKFTTPILINSVLNNTPERGFTFDELKKRRRISDQLEKAEKEKLNELILEDSDFETLRECVKNMNWAVRSKEIESFCSIFL